MIYTKQVLLVTVLVIQLSYADIPFTDVKLEVFDTKPTNFEKAISESMETIKNFWADETVEKVIGTGSVIVHFLPFGEAITTIAEATIDLLKDESDWKRGFVKELEKQQHTGIIKNQIEWFKAQVATINATIPLLDKDEEPNIDTRRGYVWSIHKDLHTMLEYYHSRSGLFRRYPLLTAPLLINLGYLITTFAPISNDTLPSATTRLPIACKGYDSLMLYRSLAVYHRLQKTNLKYLRYKEVMQVISTIDKQGMNTDKLACGKGCRSSTSYCQSKTNAIGLCSPPERVAEACEKTCTGLDFNDVSHCIKDEFGTDEYETLGHLLCVYDYTALIRSRVEKMFPDEYLKKLCKRAPRIPNGFGWVTINLGVVAAYGLMDGRWCDIPKNNPCDTFVLIYINDTYVDETPVVDDTIMYDANHIFISDKISKSSKIKIEIMDADSVGNADLVLRTEGTIDDFIKNPFRTGGDVSTGILPERNSINTFVVWEDDY